MTTTSIQLDSLDQYGRERIAIFENVRESQHETVAMVRDDIQTPVLSSTVLWSI